MIDDIVRAKLDKIDHLYPLDRLEKSKERWSKIWAGQPQTDHYPYLFAPMLYVPYSYGLSFEDKLLIQLDDFISRGIFNDDAIPALFPGCNQAAIPNVLGAPQVIVGEDFTCERIIRSARDVDDLRIDMSKGTIAYDVLEFQKRSVDITDGRIPVHVFDMQGPFDAAAQMCGYENLIFMAYDEPEQYDKYMRIVSEAYCQFWDKQKEILQNHFIGTHLFMWDYIPPMKAVSMSIDSLVMVSPDFFDEYVLPYMKSISERMGKLIIHSCGNFSHVIPALMKEDIIIGVNASQLSLDDMITAGLSKDKVVIMAPNAIDAPAIITRCKEENYRADIGIYGPYPVNDNNKWMHSSQWSDKDKEWFMGMHDQIVSAAKISD